MPYAPVMAGSARPTFYRPHPIPSRNRSLRPATPMSLRGITGWKACATGRVGRRCSFSFFCKASKPALTEAGFFITLEGTQAQVDYDYDKGWASADEAGALGG
jgi:hypothetical protein